MTQKPTRPAPKTAQQRQAAHRARRRATGHKFVTAALPGPAADALAAMARQHGQPVARILELGVLLARRALQASKP